MTALRAWHRACLSVAVIFGVFSAVVNMPIILEGHSIGLAAGGAVAIVAAGTYVLVMGGGWTLISVVSPLSRRRTQT